MRATRRQLFLAVEHLERVADVGKLQVHSQTQGRGRGYRIERSDGRMPFGSMLLPLGEMVQTVQALISMCDFKMEHVRIKAAEDGN